MDELNDRILARGVEVRFTAEERDAVDEIADPFCDWVKQNWTLDEFFDEGTTRSTHPRYKGTYLRRVHIKTKERREKE